MRLVTILAHRGNRGGPSRADENRLPALAAALEAGWGLEIDIRRAPDGRFYLSCDPNPLSDDLVADVCAVARRHPAATLAFNIQECGYEADLVSFLAEQDVLGQAFLFDMELVESTPGETARRVRAINPGVRLAARVSDHGESIERALGITEASIIWLDEFDGPWATEADVRRLKAAGRFVHAVSPDLHGFPFEAARARWAQFVRWGVDGICTDYPAELEDVLDGILNGTAA